METLSTSQVQSPTMSNFKSAPITQSPAIYIEDSFKGYPIESFSLQHFPAEDLESVLIPGGMVKDRIDRLGSDIYKDLPDEDVTFLCVLKGGFQFFNQLLEVVRLNHRLNPTQSYDGPKSGKARLLESEFIRLISYQNESSTGIVKFVGDETLISLKGKNVIIVEDIVDSGASIDTLLKALDKVQIKSVRVASLFFKRTVKNKKNYKPEYIGFSIPDSFIVGCNLDYNSYFRDLEHVCVISDIGKDKYRVVSSQNGSN